MFKRLLPLLICLLAVPAHAVPPPYAVAMPAGTPMVSGTPGQAVSAAADKYGNQQVVLVAPGGTGESLAKAEDSVHVSGDSGVMTLGVARDSSTSLGAQGDYVPNAINTLGALQVDVNSSFRVSGATSILKLEDAAAASGDALVGVAGVINTSLTSPAANGDYAAPSLGSSGQAISTLMYDSAISSTLQPVGGESSSGAWASGAYGMKTLYQAQDPLTVDVTTGQGAFVKTDLAGRTITTLAPAGESFQSCSGIITNTTPTSIKAPVAANRHYITSVTCTNASAVASLVNIVDGGGSAMVTGGMGNSTLQGVGVWNQTFPVPLRGTSGAAVNATVITTGTSTICCISGYVSVN